MKKPSAIILIICLNVLHIKNASAQATNKDDSLILVNLYNSTNGSQWIHHDNWLSGKVSTWYGISITNSRVTGISLPSNNLQSTIPPSLGNLDQLQNLDLSFNLLQGNIPFEIFTPEHLGFMYLSHNKLNGNIPFAIGNLKNIVRLELNDNQLTGQIPPTVKFLRIMAYLNVSNNQLTEMRSLDFLYGKSYYLSLNLSNNKFTFTGIEKIANAISGAQYSPQAPINIHYYNGGLAVSAGGNLSHNNYSWYDAAGTQVYVGFGDSVFYPTQSGAYHASVFNPFAGQLKLTTDTVIFTIATKNAISCYPNPAKDKLAINGLNSKKTNVITLSSLQGKMLISTTVGNTTSYVFNIAKLNSGTYLLSVNDGTSVTKIS